MREGFRFDPPRFELDAETAWVFARAFGPVDKRFEQSIDGDRAEQLARQLDLSARIGSRIPSERLTIELGPENSKRFIERYRAAAANSVAAAGLCRLVAQNASAVGAPLVFLKGAALSLLGLVKIGSREACDVDVLVNPQNAKDLESSLVRNGLNVEGKVPSDSQLAPIRHKSGQLLELHVMVRGLRLENSTDSATLDGLISAGQCEPVGGFPSGSYTPNPDALLSHLLVHGISQHSMKPDSYPMTRILADVQDYSMDELDWERFITGPFSMISRDVSRDEIMAISKLVSQLGAGDEADVIVREDGLPARFLRHVVLGSTDPDYCDAIRLRYLSDPLPASGKSAALVRNAFYSVFLNDAQVDRIYGKPASRFGYVGWKIWRPFDLVIRAGRYGVAAVKHRFRR